MVRTFFWLLQSTNAVALLSVDANPKSELKTKKKQKAEVIASLKNTLGLRDRMLRKRRGKEIDFMVSLSERS